MYPITLRQYTNADEDAAIELWQRTWQVVYPDIDFSARVPEWRARWRNKLVLHTTIIVAERENQIIGFVTVDPQTHYMDQFIVAPEYHGTGIATLLMKRGKSVSPSGIMLSVNQSNVRAIRFYEKHGFVCTGESINKNSKLPTFLMVWNGVDRSN